MLFLDEPTIGLDVVSKARLLDFLAEINRERGVTILLTTHDISDIERLCRADADHRPRSRDLRWRCGLPAGSMGGERVLVVDLRCPAALQVPGATLERVDGSRQWLRFRRTDATAAQVIARVAEQAQILDLTVEEPAIEEIVRTIYLEGITR